MNGGNAELIYYIAIGPPSAGTGFGLGGFGAGGVGGWALIVTLVVSVVPEDTTC